MSPAQDAGVQSRQDLTFVRAEKHNLRGVANERFNSWLIDEGDTRPIGVGSVSRMLLTGILLTIIGVVVVWAVFLLLASA
jgi:hypothetical protein